jgi:thiol-disulfide isomerase/thioredoxin
MIFARVHQLFRIICYSDPKTGIYRWNTMKKLALVMVVVVTLGVIALALAQDSTGGDDVASQFAGKVPAPDFPTGVDWLNVPAPLTLEALRGKIVLLDFWTYGCINCIHMIPVLEQIETKYADEMVVVGSAFRQVRERGADREHPTDRPALRPASPGHQ